MISAKRIVEIFRTRGGGTDFIDTAQKLAQEQVAYVRALAEAEPIIAKMSMDGEWLALTKSQLVIEQGEKVFRVPFDSIERVQVPKEEMLNQRLKVDGGSLDLGLQGGILLRIIVQPGGPYMGLLNVLSRMATINRRKFKVVEKEQMPSTTTNDRRPTKQS